MSFVHLLWNRTFLFCEKHIATHVSSYSDLQTCKTYKCAVSQIMTLSIVYQRIIRIYQEDLVLAQQIKWGHVISVVVANH